MGRRQMFVRSSWNFRTEVNNKVFSATWKSYVVFKFAFYSVLTLTNGEIPIPSTLFRLWTHKYFVKISTGNRTAYNRKNNLKQMIESQRPSTQYKTTSPFVRSSFVIHKRSPIVKKFKLKSDRKINNLFIFQPFCAYPKNEKNFTKSISAWRKVFNVKIADQSECFSFPRQIVINYHNTRKKCALARDSDDWNKNRSICRFSESFLSRMRILPTVFLRWV